MALSTDLLTQFAKVTLPEPTKNQKTLYGTFRRLDGTPYVMLDGSDRLTPVYSTATATDGDRVTVVIKNHIALVTGNLSDPSASSIYFDEVKGKVAEFEIVIADKVSTIELEAQIARINDLYAENVTITGTLTAANAEIENLKAVNVNITGELTAVKADIDNLHASKLDADVADITYAHIDDLDATNAVIYNLQGTFAEFVDTTTDTLKAQDAAIIELESKVITTETLNANYATIDFANIGEAAIENFLSKSGMVKDLVVGDGVVTGELVGVTIRGDQIIANSIVADKLVVQGEDGLYYKLNVSGETVAAEQTDYNSLSGTIITAQSITADKIYVTDLAAFDATIGGFTITYDALYSGVKSSVSNGTRGVYMDQDGQFAVGDGDNYVKYFKDTDGKYKLSIKSDEINQTVQSNIGDALVPINNDITSISGKLNTVTNTANNNASRLSIAESQILQNATDITLRVRKDGVISSINQSAESVKISAQKVDVNGIVTFINQHAGQGQSGYTQINGGALVNDSITNNKIATNAIKSRNYKAGSTGSFLNLSDGSFASKNLKWDSNGTITINGGNINLTDEGSGTTSKRFKITGAGYTFSAASANISIEYGNYSSNLSLDQLWVHDTDVFWVSGLTGQIRCNAKFVSNIRFYQSTSERQIGWDQAGSVKHNVYFYGRPTNNTNNDIVGMYDATSSKGIWAYGADGVFYTYTTLRTNKVIVNNPGLGGQMILFNAERQWYITNTGSGANNQLWFCSTSNKALGIHSDEVGTTILMNPAQGSIDLGFDGRIWNSSIQHLYLRASSEGSYVVHLGVHDGRWTFDPDANGTVALGTQNHRWTQLFATTSTISTSDENLKNSIEEIDIRYLELFKRLQPVTYKFNDGTSGRTHIGFISQRVKEAMDAVGITDLEFAGYCRDQKTVQIESAVPDDAKCAEPIGETYKEDVPIEDEYIYSLRYEEFIALNTRMIQECLKEIENLKNQIQYLKEGIVNGY